MTLSLLTRIDDFAYRRLTRSWSAAKVSAYAENIAASHDEAVVPDVFRQQFALIDGKSATLLIHTSMMVAAIGIVATIIADHRIEQFIMIFEIMAYLVVSILCLRATSLFGELSQGGEHPALGRELIMRRELLSLSNTATIYLTIVVLITLPIFVYV